MDPEAVFRNQMAALAARDVDRVVAHFSPDCRLIDMATPEEPYVGAAGLRDFLIDYFGTWEVHDVSITNLLTTGSKVAAEVEITVSPVGAAAVEVPRTVIRSSLFDEIVNGLIVCERAYRDPAGRAGASAGDR